MITYLVVWALSGWVKGLINIILWELLNGDCKIGKLPNGNIAKWEYCQMGILPNGNCQMGILPNGNAKWEIAKWEYCQMGHNHFIY